MERHTVYFYENDPSLTGPIVEFVKKGLEQEETVIVIATDNHRLDLKTKLLADNVIGLESTHDAHYMTLDASATLSLFMRDGWPDEHLFLNVIGQMIGSVQKGPAIRIYQELTAVLLAERDYLVALQIERLWKKLVKNGAVCSSAGIPHQHFMELRRNTF